MSNYAPNPSKKPIYTNLATKSLEDVTADDIQTITNPVKLASVNQDALIVNNIVNEAAMRNSGRPIPETMRIELTSSSSDGSKVDIITPEKGSVYEIYAGQAVVTGISGSVIHEFYLTDNNNSREMLIYYNRCTNRDPVRWVSYKFIE